MGKFKKGDKVKCVDNGGAPRSFVVGNIYTVDEYDVTIVRCTNGDGMYAHRFELVAPEFKVGDRVKMVRNVDGLKAECGATIVKIKDGIHLNVLIKFDEPIAVAHSGHGFGETRFYWFVSASDIELLPTPAATPVAETWVPKVGDRVVATMSTTIIKKGEEYTIVAPPRRLNNSNDFFIDTRTHGFLDYSASSFKPAATPFTIEAGKFYKTRDGRKVGPIVLAQGPGEPWPWKERGSEYYYKDNGYSCPGHAAGHKASDDLVALWQEEPATAPVAAATNDNVPKFKVGDRVRVIHDGNGIGGSRHGRPIGSVFTLREMNPLGTFWRTDGPDFYAKELELHAPSTPTIVALIENDTPRPASKPKVHATTASATEEASRLAVEHPGQTFGIFVLADSKIADVVMTPSVVLRAA
jgi:hypothetical protein